MSQHSSFLLLPEHMESSCQCWSKKSEKLANAQEHQHDECFHIVVKDKSPNSLNHISKLCRMFYILIGWEQTVVLVGRCLHSSAQSHSCLTQLIPAVKGSSYLFPNTTWYISISWSFAFVSREDYFVELQIFHKSLLLLPTFDLCYTIIYHARITVQRNLNSWLKCYD